MWTEPHLPRTCRPLTSWANHFHFLVIVQLSTLILVILYIINVRAARHGESAVRPILEINTFWFGISDTVLSATLESFISDQGG